MTLHQGGATPSELTRLQRENERLTASLDRYRYVWHWWAADSYDSGGEFNARMNWARGEDVEDNLTNDQVARIGQQFLKQTGRNR